MTGQNKLNYLIPPRAPTPTPKPTPTPLPIGIYVVSHRDYVDSLGRFWIFGEVENNGSVNLEWVKVNVKLYDENDALVGTKSSFIDLDIILPREKSPFSILILDAPSVDHYEVKVVGYDITGEQPYRDFEILSQSSSIDALGWLNVVGEIKNNGAKAVEFIKILVTFYDADSKVVATARTYTEEDVIAPNETGTFDVTLIYNDLVPLVDHYVIQIQGSPI